MGGLLSAPKPKPMQKAPAEPVVDEAKILKEQQDQERLRTGRAATMLTGETGTGGKMGAIGTRMLIGGGS
jgi:hypothetical protein